MDAVRADIRVISPVPPVERGLTRTIYIWKSEDDFIEFGWEWIVDSGIGEDGTDLEPTVFATKSYNGSWSESEGDPGNPGTGTLGESTDHRFRITRNPNGDDSKRYEMFRDQLYFGFYNQSRMQSGGAVVAGDENWDACDDAQSHMWTLQKQAYPGPWDDWSAVHKFIDHDTRWWWHDHTNAPPEWWVEHCASAWCSDG